MNCRFTLCGVLWRSLVLLGVTFFGIIATVQAQSEPLAVLERQDPTWRGLPGFGKNAIPALFGEYSLSALSDTRLRVFATREVLYLTESEWASVRVASVWPGRVKLLEGEAESSSAILFYRFTEHPGNGANPPLWSVIFIIPEGISSTLRDTFIQRWMERFRMFLINAHSEGEVSLPAILN